MAISRTENNSIPTHTTKPNPTNNQFPSLLISQAQQQSPITPIQPTSPSPTTNIPETPTPIEPLNQPDLSNQNPPPTTPSKPNTTSAVASENSPTPPAAASPGLSLIVDLSKYNNHPPNRQTKTHRMVSNSGKRFERGANC
ncbi:hypothetical protein COLO4_03816 [Corchorus olitorius]|uniref:Uncharacterized protein n=1 Tax=Corchorus olitorius TaxID=93759 RepID=A0A1R3KWH0_9ROSI|nr:hypothetical protein COLO4_03816 [Corchorus olitorius]